MSAEVGAAVSDILDRAAKKYIERNAPDFYHQFQWQVHGAGTVRHYDGSDAYWKRVQATLDFFFTSEQRVEAVRCLLERADLGRRPECRCFVASALAESRLADLIAGATSAAMALRLEAPNRACGAWDSIRRGYS